MLASPGSPVVSHVSFLEIYYRLPIPRRRRAVYTYRLLNKKTFNLIFHTLSLRCVIGVHLLTPNRVVTPPLHLNGTACNPSPPIGTPSPNGALS